MFKRIISYNCIPKQTYYNEFTLSSFPIVSRKDMEKMLKKMGWIRESAHKGSPSHIIINWTRVSVRRVSIIMFLFKGKDLHFFFDWHRFIIYDSDYIYDFKEYLKSHIITMDDILITPK